MITQEITPMELAKADVKAMRYSVLGHRIMLNFDAMADGIQEETIVDAIVGSVMAP